MRFDIITGVKFRKDGSQLMPHEVQQAKRRLLENAGVLLGGATVSTGEGSYMSPTTGKLTVEPVFVFTLIGPFEKRELVQNLAGVLKDDLSQESVLVTEQEAWDYTV